MSKATGDLLSQFEAKKIEGSPPPPWTGDGRHVWRVGAGDVEDYISEAYRRTAERIAAGDLSD